MWPQMVPEGGRCLFSPLQIPMAVLDISSAQHPVKAGLSDAFMILNSSPDVPGEFPYRYLHVDYFSLSYGKISSEDSVRNVGLFWLTDTVHAGRAGRRQWECEVLGTWSP